MEDITIVYGKRLGEPRVPFTVRIEWLPNGKIKPLAFQTPNGVRFEVIRVIECTNMAYLKDRGEGLRFKVRAQITEMPESDDEPPQAQCETYLYLADDWFCGKNFVDERYGHDKKEFISVTLDVFPDGEYELVCFTVQETVYTVEKTIAVEHRGSFSAGGVGIRHKVEARAVGEDNNDDNSNMRLAALYFEVNKWFVSRKR